MVAAIVVVSVLLFAMFIVAAVAGNRAQTRMMARQAEERSRGSDADGRA